MNLEELIYKRLSEYEDLTNHLATFSGVPAIFSPEAPADEQDGWNGKMQYPKIVYNMDMRANEERSSVGVLSVALFCQNTEDIVPENIEKKIRDSLLDVILEPEDGSPYCFTWTATEHFTVEQNKESMVIGSELRFDILEYTSQETTDPDPIAAVNRYIKNMYPESIILWYDKMKEITEPTKEHPVIYCRLLSMEKAEETNTVAWMDGKIAVHILCPDSDTRVKMAASISNSVSLDGEIIMLDKSPMFIRSAQANYKTDYLKTGQIFITGHYGLIRYKPKQHILQKINMEEGGNRMKTDTTGKQETTKDTSKTQIAESGSVYSIPELAENAKNVFGKNSECVAAALRSDGKTEYTVSDAKKIVEKFLKKEVK